jgi:hypothetical protein
MSSLRLVPATKRGAPRGAAVNRQKRSGRQKKHPAADIGNRLGGCPFFGRATLGHTSGAASLLADAIQVAVGPQEDLAVAHDRRGVGAAVVVGKDIVR